MREKVGGREKHRCQSLQVQLFGKIGDHPFVDGKPAVVPVDRQIPGDVAKLINDPWRGIGIFAPLLQPDPLGFIQQVAELFRQPGMLGDKSLPA